MKTPARTRRRRQIRRETRTQPARRRCTTCRRLIPRTTRTGPARQCPHCQESTR